MTWSASEHGVFLLILILFVRHFWTIRFWRRHTEYLHHIINQYGDGTHVCAFYSKLIRPRWRVSTPPHTPTLYAIWPHMIALIFNGFSMIFQRSTAGASTIDGRSFEIYRCSLIALIFNSCSMIFQRSTAGASTIDGRSFEIYRCSLIALIFNGFSMIFQRSTAGASTIDGRSFEIYRCSLIALIFNSCSMIFQRSTAGASTIDGRSFEIYRCSLIFNDSQWFFNDLYCFSIVLHWAFDHRCSMDLSNDVHSCSLIFHWFSIVVQWFVNDRRPERSTIDGQELWNL